MNAEEIRKLPQRFDEMSASELATRYDWSMGESPKLVALKIALQVEIAAQLAEINAQLQRANELFGQQLSETRGGQ
jgi:hypothetical protein